MWLLHPLSPCLLLSSSSLLFLSSVSPFSFLSKWPGLFQAICDVINFLSFFLSLLTLFFSPSVPLFSRQPLFIPSHRTSQLFNQRSLPLFHSLSLSLFLSHSLLSLLYAKACHWHKLNVRLFAISFVHWCTLLIQIAPFALDCFIYLLFLLSYGNKNAHFTCQIAMHA